MKNYTTKKINDSTIELEITITKDAVNKSYETLLKNELKNVKVKGFRAGNAPREVVEKEMKPKILFEVFNRLAPLNVRSVVDAEKIELIATPEFKDIPNLTLENDLVFKVHATVMPDFKLGNMKKVKVEVKQEEVSEKDVDSIFTQLESHKGIKAKKGTKKWVEEASTILSLTKTDDMAALRAEVKATLQKEKEALILRKAENEALNQAIKLSEIEIPDPAIHFEAHEREHEFNHQLQGMGMRLDQYAQQMGVTVQSLVDGFHKDAKEALETDVFLKLYAKDKKIVVTDERLEEEVAKVKQSNPNKADMYENPEWKEYIRRVVLKQEAYTKFLGEVLPKKK